MATFDRNNFEIPSFTQPFDIESQQNRFGTQGDILGRLRGTIGGFETLPAMSSRIGGELMLPEQRENVLRLGELTGDLQSQLRALPKQVAGRTKESLVTAPQQARIIQSEGQPLMNSLSDLGSIQEQAGARLSQSEGQLGQRLGIEQAQQQLNLLPFEFEFNAEEQTQAREFSGYTAQMQSELNRLVANLQAGVQLSEGDLARANQLSIAEKGYESQLSQIRLQSDLSNAAGDPLLNSLFNF